MTTSSDMSFGALEAYANLDTLGRECVDFVSALTGPERIMARGYLRLLGEATRAAGQADVDLDEVDVDLLRLIVENVAAKVAGAQRT